MSAFFIVRTKACSNCAVFEKERRMFRKKFYVFRKKVLDKGPDMVYDAVNDKH